MVLVFICSEALIFLCQILTEIFQLKHEGQFHFFKAIRPQAARHIVPGDCFITTSISKEVMPEMVPLSVLQHQIPNFRIKLEKFSHRIYSHIFPFQFLSKMYIKIQGLLKKTLSMLLTQIQIQPIRNLHSHAETCSLWPVAVTTAVAVTSAGRRDVGHRREVGRRNYAATHKIYCGLLFSAATTAFFV